MHQRQPGAQSHRRAIALFATAAVLVAGCADLAPPTVLSSDAAGSGGPPSQLPAIDLPLPNGDTDTTQVLLENAGGVFDVYRSVGRLAGASLACTLVLVDAAPGVTTGPAYALTNGHCVGINGNDVLVDQPLDGATAVFDYFADTPERREVPVTKVVYASMKGTDLAILQLDATVGALADAGYHPWPIGDIGPLDGSSRDVIMTGAPVGAPIVDIPEAERYLRLGTCSLDTDPVRINERLWLWSALRNDCPEVLPGNSGSPVIDIETATLVGLINTTTYKGENGAPCWLGRPCEVADNGEDALPDTSYAMPLGSLSGCFAADGSFALGTGCALDPGDGVTLTGVPVAVNPAADDPIGGAGTARTTWATTVEGAGFTTYRYKIEPLETADCAHQAGYGEPVPIAQPIEDPLPTEEQRLLLCVVGGPSATPDSTWQTASNASFAVVYIDTTPPTTNIEFAKRGNATNGWSIEPIFVPPELSLFVYKSGPAGTTRCSDRRGYVAYRRTPLNLPAGGPWRYCAIGFDDANNASAPAGVVLK